MKYLVIFCSSFILLLPFCKAQSSWKSPGYKPETYRKIMVLAKTSDDLAKRQIEDATVKLLNEKGITAIPSYTNIAEADLASETTFLAKADALELDGLIVYSITGNETEYKNTPSVNASIGVPVRLGIFGGFIGGSVPIAGGSKSVSIVKANAAFYNRSSNAVQWSTALSGKLKNGADKLAAGFAKTTVSAMMKDSLFIQQ